MWNYFHVELRETSNSYIKPTKAPLSNLLIMLPPRLQCSLTYQVNFNNTLLMMSATKPADLTLAI